MLDDLEEKRPGTKQIMLAALQNVHPSHLLDRSLWKRARSISGEGDGARGAADHPARSPGPPGVNEVSSAGQASAVTGGRRRGAEEPPARFVFPELGAAAQAAVPGFYAWGVTIMPAAWSRGAPVIAKVAAIGGVIALVGFVLAEPRLGWRARNRRRVVAPSRRRRHLGRGAFRALRLPPRRRSRHRRHARVGTLRLRLGRSRRPSLVAEPPRSSPGRSSIRTRSPATRSAPARAPGCAFAAVIMRTSASR